MTMNKGAQRKSILPTVGKVLHTHVLVTGGLALAPEQQSLLGRKTLLAVQCASKYKVLRYSRAAIRNLPDLSDGETENNG